MSTYSDHEQRLLDQQSGAELDRLAARRASQTSQRPTQAEFEKLLHAFLGAHEHSRWTSDNGSDAEYAIALKAATDAYRAVVNAACAPCPSCGMQLK